MSQISSGFGNLPGMGTVIETYEAAITWGPASQLLWWNGYISANAVDIGNTPTYKLRPGLVLGLITASGQWTNYSPTASDGSQVAAGVLAYGLRMQDVLSGQNVSKFYAIIIGGNVKGANLLGLDGMARAQMRAGGYFRFDDMVGLPGAATGLYPFMKIVTKTSNYSIVAADNFTQFDNATAGAAVTFTLPPIANGYMFGFRAVAAQNLIVASFEGDNIVALNDDAADSVAFQTGSQIIGGGFVLYSNPAATRWYMQNTSAGSNTITVTT